MMNKKDARLRRARQTRAKIAEMKVNRLTVFRTNSHIYAQVIDDSTGRTLAAASSLEPDLKSSKATKRDEAAVVGRLVAERARAAGVGLVVFDRAGFRYHGRVKSLADAAREAGLDF
jgi:large subunit ribosomal protein L18